MKAVIFIFYVLYGTIIGSFLNVCIYRIPAGISVVKGRSYCPKCRNTISPFDLIPILSYLMLGRKCRHCKESISPRYALIEGITGLLFGLVFLQFDLTIHSVLACLMTACLIVVAFIDIDTGYIPDRMHIFLLVLGVVGLFLPDTISIKSKLFGVLIISVPLLILAYFFDGFGGGDIKLFASAGLIIGTLNSILAFFIAVILGGGYAIYLLISKKRAKSETFAFGGFICIGIFLACLYNEYIITAYLNMFGI